MTCVSYPADVCRGYRWCQQQSGKSPVKVIRWADADHAGASVPVIGLHQIRRNNSVDFDDVRYTVPNADVLPVIRIGARLWQQ